MRYDKHYQIDRINHTNNSHIIKKQNNKYITKTTTISQPAILLMLTKKKYIVLQRKQQSTKQQLKNPQSGIKSIMNNINMTDSLSIVQHNMTPLIQGNKILIIIHKPLNSGRNKLFLWEY